MVEDIKKLKHQCSANEQKIPFKTKISQHLLGLVAMQMENGGELKTASDPLTHPLLKQFLPSKQELIMQDGFGKDPFAERKYNPLPGVFHKYRQRVLLTVSRECEVHCRFCFRRWMPIKIPDWPKTIAYLKDHSQVEEVVLSGGDPLALSCDKLQTVMEQLSSVSNLHSVRVHSRIPIACPAKCYNFPWNRYPSLRKILVIHCNHPQEISKETVQLCKDLNKQQVALFSQTVLLKGVNDRVKVLKELYGTLWGIGVQPYYLHLLDRVQGAAHFEVSSRRAIRLYALLQHCLPGYLIPKLVREEHDGKCYISNR